MPKFPAFIWSCWASAEWKDQTIFDYIRDHRLRPVVHPMGYQPWEMLPLFYSASAVFVFPSFYKALLACG
jgi:glycosyltransferase involved in cell wall biosynthesis